MAAPKKSLGQHWLRDRDTLSYIAECADINPEDKRAASPRQKSSGRRV